MSKIEDAISIFNNNFNCAQAVLSAFAEDLNIEKDLSLKISSGFGGGMGNGEVCGAVVGAIIALGLKYGHFKENDLTTKKVSGKKTIDFIDRFKKENNFVTCNQLLGYDITNPEDHRILVENKVFDKVCPKVITSSVSILESMLKTTERN